jgi:hypothetical protein
MLRKITFALVAAASLSAIALAPSAASARGFGGGGGHGFGGGHSGFHEGFGGDRRFFHHDFGRGFAGYGYGDGCYSVRRIWTAYGYRLRTVNVCG